VITNDQVLFKVTEHLEIGTLLRRNPEISGHWLIQASDAVLSVPEERMFLFQATNDWVN
jgi:hypothetical protein